MDMGDDAELYWEMEHNPYFWDEVESCSRNNSFTENKSKKKKKTIQTKSNSTRKKVNAALFIDGENISSKKAEQIQKIANKQGVLGIEKVYGLQKDECTKSWSDRSILTIPIGIRMNFARGLSVMADGFTRICSSVMIPIKRV